MAKRIRKPLPLHKLTDKTPRNDKKRYQVIPKTKDMAEQPPVIDGKEFVYGRSGSCMTDDSGVANEIQAKYGEDVEIWELEDKWHPADQGHKYRFSGIQLPWHRYDEFGRRIDDIIPLEVQYGEKEHEARRGREISKDGRQAERQSEQS